MSTPSVDALALTESLELFVRDLDANTKSLSDDARHRLSEAARKLRVSTEGTLDSVHRIIQASMQLPLACIGMDTKLFDVLTNIEGTATVAELAEETKVEPALMARLLRYYQSVGMVSQMDDDAYGASNVTKAMATIAGKNASKLYLDGVVPVTLSLPRFLRETGYANPTDVAVCPWQSHFQESHWEWLKARPGQQQHMLLWMQHYRDGLPTFLDAVDMAPYMRDATDSTPVFVDVGGGRGYQCVGLKKKYPGLRGRVVVQDQPHVVEDVRANPLPGFDGIEAEPYDIFTPQKLTGARVYYMRYVLHDWPDDACVAILRNAAAGMTAASTLLIDETMMPARGASWRAASMDLVMACCISGTDRGLPDYEALLRRAGLRVAAVYPYTAQLNDCVVAAVLC
ncbi:S-adenosyl-L-methionine-dependent methyltransferase [Hypoxylon sp. FL1284]|nr:S-adenosyl-L-methionine-dependent methyltransferase [Hypoxylon sp. FL1284]